MAVNVIPIKRKGKVSSQMIGQSTKASKASGQHRAKRANQATTAMRVFKAAP
jgi:hypothetical protein